MRLVFLVVASLAALELAGCSDSGSSRADPYSPPTTVEQGNGWLGYVGPPMVDRDAAESLDPSTDSPEAAVVKFLASRLRGDSAWEAALVPEPSDRTRRQIAEWDRWELQRFQLRARRDRGDSRADIKVYFEITFNGRSDEGEDEFEVVRTVDGWRVASVPA